MAYKILGQSSPTSSLDTNVYTVPSGKEAVISTITVCNVGSTLCTYRIAARSGSEAIQNRHYIVYDAEITTSETIALTFGMTLSENDTITVRSSVSSSLAFNIFGNES
jgi:hypothetical protein